MGATLLLPKVKTNTKTFTRKPGKFLAHQSRAAVLFAGRMN